MAEIKDKVVTVESLSALHEHNKETYMTKVDPIGSGSLSMNRKAGTEIGVNSVALGVNNEASGNNSIALGTDNKASANWSYAEGLGTVAAGYSQHVQGMFNIEDSLEEYIHIIGNGSGDDERSNAHTVTWYGDAWYAGNLSFDGNLILTSNVYGDELPAAGTVGRIFFKKISE